MSDSLWTTALAVGAVLLSALASGHAIVNKRDSRSAVGWVALAWLAPFIGAACYATFGVNRIRRRARIQRRLGHPKPAGEGAGAPDPEALAERFAAPDLQGLAELGDRANGRPLRPDNHVRLLVDGEEAYPAMLAAIAAAERSVCLATYIFDADRAGYRFLEALREASARGVEVRVLVDDVGARYSRPAMPRLLEAAGVRVARFLPTTLPWRMPYMNLRCHRKLLVVDGRVAFTGGMNIRHGHLLAEAPLEPVRDVHAALEGPIDGDLQRGFAEDWVFTTREELAGPAWFPPLEPAGDVVARACAGGPDEDFGTIRMALLGALAVARRQVRVMTPYFLPDSALITALNVAALRGVRVDLVLPSRSNLVMMQWATRAVLWQVLERGCHVWSTPPPFDHSKLMVVDEAWTLLGSANWDVRSLRLNFELNVECYDRDLAERAAKLIDSRIAASHEITLDEVDSRPLPTRLRDGTARLFASYL